MTQTSLETPTRWLRPGHGRARIAVVGLLGALALAGQLIGCKPGDGKGDAKGDGDGKGKDAGTDTEHDGGNGGGGKGGDGKDSSVAPGGDAAADTMTRDDASVGDGGAADDAGGTTPGDDTGFSLGGHSTVVWSQDFEDGPGDWTVEGGVWAFGAPTGTDAPSARSGDNVAGTDLDESYGTSQNARLISPEFLVAPEADLPHFRFWYWYQFLDTDYGQLQIRVDGGAWTNVATGQIQQSGEHWVQRIVDLSPYARKRVQLGFRFVSNGSGNARGWYIDDASLETGPMDTSPIGFEKGFGDWSVEGGVWAIGAPTGTDAPSVHAGDNVVGTYLGESYGTSQDARLISPEFLVAPEADLPHFRFWYWYQFLDTDYGQLQIRVDGGAWTNVATGQIQQSGEHWVQRIVDLSPYARKRVQLGFRFVSNGSGNARGWYIDDASLETGPMDTSPIGFEKGFGDWSVEGGVWAIGAPTGTDAPSVHAGDNVVGTYLGESYGTSQDARLVSPMLLVPPEGANPRLRYWYWYQFLDTDYGQLQVRVDGGSWQNVAGGQIKQLGENWSQGMVDLRPYARKTVQIGFRFVSNGSGNARGWYVDDVMLEMD